MRLLWYGCSWVEGVKEDITPFPDLVSSNLDLEYENRGVRGSSIDDMVEVFSNDYNTGKLTESDVVIFCATSSYRITWAEHFRFTNSYYFWANVTFTGENEKEKSWILNFADDDICSFLAFKNLSLLYFMCQSMNIKCFFVNSFYPLKQQINNLIPSKNWLMPHDQSCVDVLNFSIIEPEPALFDIPKYNSYDWINHKEKIEKYLIPDDSHPNQLGNETIANYLTTKLKAKL